MAALRIAHSWRSGCCRFSNIRGGPDLLWAERVRYLSELVWAPDAILCNPHLRWLALDECTLLVSTGEAPDSAHVMVHLDARGRIQTLEAESESIDSTAHADVGGSSDAAACRA